MCGRMCYVRQDVQVLWLGDGITEGWRGTSLKVHRNHSKQGKTIKIQQAWYSDAGDKSGCEGIGYMAATSKQCCPLGKLWTHDGKTLGA